MFIQTEPTPNPAVLKFLPGRSVLGTGTLDMRDKGAAAQSPLAERLFDIPNVGGVFYGSDFIAVTKTDGEWHQLRPAILGAIMEHFMSDVPLVRSDAADASAGSDEFFETKDAETVATIKELLETRVKPAVENDGGDISFRGFKDGVVYLDMKGACSGCPSSTATLRHGCPAVFTGSFAIADDAGKGSPCASLPSTPHSKPARLLCSTPSAGLLSRVSRCRWRAAMPRR
jgi:Fe-S cluster biogenesis protein NfuA